jgi:hypothetical protein
VTRTGTTRATSLPSASYFILFGLAWQCNEDSFQENPQPIPTGASSFFPAIYRHKLPKAPKQPHDLVVVEAYS